MNGNLIAAIAAGYFLGSIPFGYLIGRLAGIRDIRLTGSGNVGATNLARSAGFGPGVATLLLDAGKGALAVWLATRWGHGFSLPIASAGLAAIVGHMFPVWLRFRGGRGVATAIGVFLMIAPLAVALDLVVWVAAMALWRYASLSSILWATLLPLAMYWLYAPGLHPSPEISVAVVLAAVLILWRHRENLRRLIAGTEPRMTFRR